MSTTAMPAGTRRSVAFRVRVFAGGIFAALLAVQPLARAENYPTQPIKIIVPFPAGGLNDTVARLIAPYLEQALGKPVIIDNRAGASGSIGTKAVAAAQPDGHTLLMVASSHTIAPATNNALPYDTEHDLAAIRPAWGVAKGPRELRDYHPQSGRPAARARLPARWLRVPPRAAARSSRHRH
jgi:hypothetical protein